MFTEIIKHHCMGDNTIAVIVYCVVGLLNVSEFDDIILFYINDHLKI